MIVEDKIKELVKGAISDLGYDIVRIKYFSNTKTLQVMIERLDREISVEDCEIVSNTISVILDVEDPISSHYNLEVSSAGLDRPLVTINDFIRFKDREIKVTLDKIVDGVRKFKGIVEEIVANSVIIRLDTKQKVQVNLENIISANLTIDTNKLFNKKRFYG